MLRAWAIVNLPLRQAVADAAGDRVLDRAPRIDVRKNSIVTLGVQVDIFGTMRVQLRSATTQLSARTTRCSGQVHQGLESGGDSAGDRRRGRGGGAAGDAAGLS